MSLYIVSNFSNRACMLSCKMSSASVCSAELITAVAPVSQSDRRRCRAAKRAWKTSVPPSHANAISCCPTRLQRWNFSDSVSARCVCCDTCNVILLSAAACVPCQVANASVLSHRGQMPWTVNISSSFCLRHSKTWWHGSPTVDVYEQKHECAVTVAGTDNVKVTN